MSGQANKRKRRSFWEPESEALKKWLDDQNELGISLQLIIVDAMRKYGEGDVIKAHLNQREQSLNGDLDLAQATPVQPPHRVVMPALEPIPESIPESKSEPEPMAQPQINKPESTAKPSTEPFDIGQMIDRETNESADSHTGSPVQQEQVDQVSENEPDSEYDPIAVMLGDADSRFSK